MERRSSFVLPVALFALAAMAHARAQEPQLIGEHGARILLAKGWKRTRFDENAAGEQLLGRKSKGLFATAEVQVYLHEHLGLLENEADYWRAFERFEDLPRAPKLTIVDEGGRRRVSKQQEHTSNDYLWTCRSELLVVDGYAMHLEFWASRSDGDKVAEMAEELVDSIALPADDSEKRQGLQPVRQAVVSGEVELSVALRPFVLRPKETAGALGTWTTVDKAQGLMAYESERVRNAEHALGQDLEALGRQYEAFRETRRAPRTIGSVGCLEADAVAKDWTFRLLVVPVGERRCLVLRHWAMGASGEVRPDRDAIFASLQLQPTAVAGLPKVPPEQPSARTLSASLRGLLAEAKVVHRLAGWNVRWAPGEAGVWFCSDHEGVHRLEGTEVRRLLPRRPGAAALAPWHDLLVVVDNDQTTLVAADGTVQPAPFAARLVARVGDRLLCVRDRLPTAAMSSGYRVLGSELWLRDRDGQERLVATLDDWVFAAAANQGADRLLVAASHQQGGFRLFEVDPASGACGDSIPLRSLSGIEPASTGWLMDGAPQGRAEGIWHVQPAGELRLLVPGSEARGVQLQGDVLWIAVQEGADSVLTTLPLAAAERAAAQFQFVDPQGLSALGYAFLASVPTAPRDQAEVVAALAKLQELARQQLGAALPTTIEVLEELLQNARDVDALAPPARIVLALLLAQCALDQGGEWVASDRASWLDWLAAVRMKEGNLFAATKHLPSSVVAVLDDSEPALRQAAWVTSRTGGQRLLCGVDTAALTAAAEAAVPTEFRTTRASEPGAWSALVRRFPQNQQLREHAYRALADGKAWRELAELAGEAVAAKQPDVEHRVMWLCARDQLCVAGATDESLERDLLAALTEHGREARLWLALGACCERQGVAALERARVCYQRASGLQQYGDVATLANAALRRLGAKAK